MSPALLPDGDDRIVVVRARSNQKIRHQIVGRGLRYYRFRNDIGYSQARPTEITLPRVTDRLDCSGLVAACMDFAGVLPKVDWRYTNTWTQIRLGRKVDPRYAKPGDVVFYGQTGNPTHEALYLGTRDQLTALEIDPPDAVDVPGKWVLSMGHYPMGIYQLDYRGDRIQVRSFL